MFVVGCGGGVPVIAPPSPPPARVSASTFESANYRFRVAYPSGWVRSMSTAAKAAKPGELVFSVAFADPKGTVAGGSYVNAMQVSVYRRPAGGGTPRALAQELLTAYAARLPKVALGPTSWKPITMKRVSGFGLRYKYTVGSVEIWAQSIALLRDDYAYLITGQASAETWRTEWPRMSVTLGAFTLL